MAFIITIENHHYQELHYLVFDKLRKLEERLSELRKNQNWGEFQQYRQEQLNNVIAEMKIYKSILERMENREDID